MVVADGVLEEVGADLRGVVQLDHDLRAAEVGLGEIAKNPALGDEDAREVAGDLEDSHRPVREVALDAHSDS